MNIVVNEVEPCKLNVSYEADALQILNKRGDIITYFKKAPVPGYRTGKATNDAIKAHYKDQIEESLKRALIEDAYQDTIFEKKLKPHGPPRINSVLMADGKFTCEFELYTKPNFELVQFKDLEVPKPHLEHDQASMYQKLLQELRIKYGETLPYSETDFVQDGDNIILDYECSLNGELIPNLSATAELLTVGNHQIPMLDANLLGMVPGETREFDMPVPEGSLPSLEGKTIHFKVSLTTGSKTIPCGLNDEFAKKFNMQNFEELSKFVNDAAMGKLSSLEKSKLNEAAANKLLDLNPINVPNWMTLSEAQYLTHQAKVDWNTLPDEDKEKYMEMSAKNVKLALILDRIRETEPASQLTDQEVFDMIKQNLMKSKTQMSLDDVVKELSRTGMLQVLMQRIKDENTLDYVVKNMKVLE